jgi:hypothetical protein
MPRKAKTTIDTTEVLGLLAQRALINEKIEGIDLKPAFVDGLKPIFDEFEKLETIGWKQYAPSFNDGDPCYFSVHNDDDSLELNGINGYGDEPDPDEDGEEGEEVPVLTEKVRDKILKKLSPALSQFSDADYQEMFGEGVSVTINRDGTVDTDEYGDY